MSAHVLHVFRLLSWLLNCIWIFVYFNSTLLCLVGVDKINKLINKNINKSNIFLNLRNNSRILPANILI